jgi:hypothetical protein
MPSELNGAAETVADVLDAAAAVYSTKRWSRFHNALDAAGREVKPLGQRRRFLPAPLRPETEAVDALGALAIASEELAVSDDIRVKALDAFKAYVGAEWLAEWNASLGEDGAARVRQKLHAAAREIRRGGPAHISALPPLHAGPSIATVAARPKRKRTFTPETKLRADRGRLVAVLVRQRNAGASEHDLAATEGRIRSVEKRLRDEFGYESPPLPAHLKTLPEAG